MRLMNGRRRFTRYVLCVPPTGCARLVSDCIVQEWDRDSAVVVTNQPAERDQEFLVQLMSPTGAMTLYPVRVMSCAPDPLSGSLRFRLHVHMMSYMTALGHGAPWLSLLNSRVGPVTDALLLRNLPLVMRDVSSGGCSIDSGTSLHVGTVGWLEVEFEGERRFEWFRVAHVQVRDEGVLLAGVEFLPLSAAGSDSLRSVIGRLREGAADGSQAVAGPSSGDLENSEDAGAASVAEPAATTTNSARKIIKFFQRR